MIFGKKRKPEDVKVYQGTGPTDAYLARDWLERNDVPCWVRGESLLSLRGELPIGEAWPTVWVKAVDEARARTLLAQFEGPTLVHPDWQCAHCGEPNGPNFMSCWSCGRDKAVVEAESA